MSTCQCGCSETGELFHFLDCGLTFKCENEYDIHKKSQKFEKTHTEDAKELRKIKKSFMAP